MPNTDKTKGPTPNIVRQGQTASKSYGLDPQMKGNASASEKVRNLKP